MNESIRVLYVIIGGECLEGLCRREDLFFLELG